MERQISTSNFFPHTAKLPYPTLQGSNRTAAFEGLAPTTMAPWKQETSRTSSSAPARVSMAHPAPPLPAETKHGAWRCASDRAVPHRLPPQANKHAKGNHSTDADNKEEERAERGRSDSTRSSPLAPHHFPLLLSNGDGRRTMVIIYSLLMTSSNNSQESVVTSSY